MLAVVLCGACAGPPHPGHDGSPTPGKPLGHAQLAGRLEHQPRLLGADQVTRLMSAPLGRVVLSTCSNTPSLELAAIGCGGFSVEAGSDSLHGRLAVDEHRQGVVDDQLIEKRRLLVGPQFDVGALGDSAKEPWFTHAKARYELTLLASRDPELAATFSQSGDGFYTLARRVVAQWHPADSTPDPALVEDQAIAILAFINGVMMTFVAGQPAVDTAEHLDRLIQGVIAGVAHVRRE
jgi:hypothetical protein